MYLDARIAPISHQDVVESVDGDSGGRVELAITLSVGAETVEELARCVKNLMSWERTIRRILLEKFFLTKLPLRFAHLVAPFQSVATATKR